VDVRRGRRRVPLGKTGKVGASRGRWSTTRLVGFEVLNGDICDRQERYVQEPKASKGQCIRKKKRNENEKSGADRQKKGGYGRFFAIRVVEHRSKDSGRGK